MENDVTKPYQMGFCGVHFGGPKCKKGFMWLILSVQHEELNDG